MLPGQASLRDAAGGQPGPDLTGFGRRLGPQAMIDGEGDGAPAARPGPAIQEQDQGHAVGPAGNGGGDDGAIFEGTQRCHQPGELGPPDRHGSSSGVSGRRSGASLL